MLDFEYLAKNIWRSWAAALGAGVRAREKTKDTAGDPEEVDTELR